MEARGQALYLLGKKQDLTPMSLLLPFEARLVVWQPFQMNTEAGMFQGKS